MLWLWNNKTLSFTSINDPQIFLLPESREVMFIYWIYILPTIMQIDEKCLYEVQFP